jgi:hypothetical protein
MTKTEFVTIKKPGALIIKEPISLMKTRTAFVTIMLMARPAKEKENVANRIARIIKIAAKEQGHSIATVVEISVLAILLPTINKS